MDCWLHDVGVDQGPGSCPCRYKDQFYEAGSYWPDHTTGGCYKCLQHEDGKCETIDTDVYGNYYPTAQECSWKDGTPNQLLWGRGTCPCNHPGEDWPSNSIHNWHTPNQYWKDADNCFTCFQKEVNGNIMCENINLKHRTSGSTQDCIDYDNDNYYGKPVCTCSVNGKVAVYDEEISYWNYYPDDIFSLEGQCYKCQEQNGQCTTVQLGHSYLTSNECIAAENNEVLPTVNSCWTWGFEYAPDSYFTDEAVGMGLWCHHCRVIADTRVVIANLGLIGRDMQNCTETGVLAGMS